VITPLDGWTAARLGLPPGAPLRPALEAHQLARLRETVAWATRRSPLYRRRLGRLPDGWPGSLGDLAALPFTSAQELRERGEELVCVSQDELARVVTLRSSGTTGTPKRLWFTAEDQAATLDFFGQGMSTLVEPGDRVLILLPGPLAGSVGALLAEALARRGVEPIRHGFVRDLPAAIEVLRRCRPTSAVGAPAQLLGLLRCAAAAGVEPGLRTALLTTDHVPRAVLRALREEHGCEPFEHYGMTELGLGGAVDCRAHQGCHLRELDLLCEVVEPSTGTPVPAGSPGELVFTTLGRRGMPLLRYRTGDRSRLLPGPCPCGSLLGRLAPVRGRIGERALELEGQRLALPDLDEALFALPSLLDFTAAAGVRCGRPALQLGILAVPGRDRGLGAAVEVALDQLPGLRARQAEIAVEVLPAPPDPWPSPGKRLLLPL
jgi:phenylacetate-CoA ligase